MGKRTGQLAGLAALGALGYMLSKDGKEGKKEAPVETRSFSPNRESSKTPAAEKASAPAAEKTTTTQRSVDEGDDRDVGGGFNPAGFRRNMETGEMYYPGTVPNRTPAASSRAASPARAAATPRSTPAVSDAYPDESRRGRMTNRASAPTASAASRPASAADQIPTDSALYRNITDGERVSGNELTRNVGNTLGALAPLGGGFGKVGAELMTAKGAAERAAKARELAEAARRAKPATTMKSTPSTAPARANQAAKSGRKKFNEDEAGIEFKRGGMTKKMASGGMSTSKASSRADGIAQRGKTRGKMY
jgi:hypothetical protein